MKSRLLISRLQRQPKWPVLPCAAILILFTAAFSCHKEKGSEAKQPAAAAAVAFPFTERIGWFQGPCLAVSNQHLAAGTPVALILTGEPQKIQPARILEPTTSPATCKALLPGRAATNATTGITFYALGGGSLGATDTGIGIAEAPTGLTVVNGLAQVDLDQDGRSEVFSSCTTSEGIRFAVWTGKTYQGEPRWSGYYYLGYDLQPTCP